jgi:DNA primase
MKYHNLDYVEAIKMLAERANMELPLDSYGGGKKTVDKKKRLYQMNRDAAKFFYKQLSAPEGRACVRYLTAERGLSVGTIKKYGMGCAPNSWSALKNHMMGLGYSEQELLEGGLISRSKNNTKNTFDFFVNRAMFPFIDLTGHIVGFGGRTLCGDKRKYVNSRENPVYSKDRFLFSMNIAKNAAVKDGRILLCEGNLDVISLAQAGFENAVASCGTALTQSQAKLISTYAKEAVICYDSDDAGQKATQKAIDILSHTDLKITVIHMKGAKDPDEYIKKFGAPAFQLLLDKADGSVSYKLSNARAKSDMTSDVGRMEYKDSAVKILASLDSPVERDVYGHKVAEELGVQYAVLEQELKRAVSKRSRAAQRKETQDMLRFADRRDSLNPEAARHPGEAKAEENIISYLYSNPDYYNRVKDVLSPDKFVTEFNRRVYAFIIGAMSEMRDFSLSSMNEAFTPDEIGKITQIIERARSEGIGEEVANDCVSRLTKYKPKENAGDMSNDDFLKLMDELKKKKT